MVGKRKDCLSKEARNPAEKRLMPPKNKLPIADQGPELSKEGFRDAQESGTTCRIAQSP